MHTGVFIFPTDTTMQPIALARACEDRGIESLWFPEHSHIPVSRITPWGGRSDAPPLPEHYWRTHDQYVALSAAAAVTSTLRLGTGITLVAQRDPLWLAKEIASLDVIAGGRFMFGIGYGWNAEEMANHGVEYRGRRDLVREKVLAIKELWTNEEASFEGEHVSFEPSWSWPKPVQKPHPPIHLGGNAGPKAIAHLAEFCDGWMPMWRHRPLEKLGAIGDALESVGRPRDDLELTLFSAPPGDKVFEQVRSHGFHRVVYGLPQGDAPEVEAALDIIAEGIARTA